MSVELHCGDCLEVLPRIPDGSIDMVFADLPYGVTQNKWDTVIPFDALWQELLRVGKANCAFVFTATQPFATSLICSQPKLFRYDLVWAKRRSTGFFTAKHAPLRSHESILVFYAKRPVYNAQKSFGHKAYAERRNRSKSASYGQHVGTLSGNDGSRWPLSVISFNQPEERSMHPTQKPVALMEWLVKTYSNPGDTVLDPVMGSGTTGVACQKTGRKFIGIEKDAQYFAIAQNRIGNEILSNGGIEDE